MIISISGKIGSGKDLVGSIIHYLIWKSKVENGSSTSIHYTFDNFINSPGLLGNLSGWKTVKFADKLKDIVCLLIGCTREQLEDRDFKEKELGEEWWYYQKHITKEVISIQEFERINSLNKGLLHSHYIMIRPTPRMLLQQIGTDLFRNQLHPLVWINATMADYKPLVSGHVEMVDFKEGTREKVSKDFPLEFPNWIVTDTRFTNEAKAITDRGGINIRINRPNMFDAAIKSVGIEHESETALDDYSFDYVINNNGTIEELIDKVKEILIKENII